ncbi:MULTISPECIES: hypothetical protein [Metabacillus]|uniref:RDD family protein n=1 Tax=Metabacillus elymi TaxID=2745198 RepID=A0ABX6S6Y8_9BACI|nr:MULTISPECIES: hypothetical protein [Metabacillus]QNF29779.1 hypothetical protein HUW50_21165 [Metabacillus sp. KUDC1714]
MSVKKQNQVVFYIIKGSTIKKFLILDCITGTSLYYAIKIISSSILIGIVGSIVGTEGIKRASWFCDKRLKIHNVV